MKQSLVLASRIQQSLLPAVPPAIPGLEVAWSFTACEDDIAGDMFNVIPLDEDHVGFYILDVSGHGVSAALLAVNLSRILSPVAAIGGVLKTAVNPPAKGAIISPVEVAETLNQHFPAVAMANQFFSLLYGILHLKTRTFRFVRAGHPPLILASVTGTRIHATKHGMAIGVSRKAMFEEGQLQLNPGETVVLYTDGVTEALNAEREFFGIDRFLEILKETTHLPLDEVLGRAERALVAHRGGYRREDDITILTFRLETTPLISDFP